MSDQVMQNKPDTRIDITDPFTIDDVPNYGVINKEILCSIVKDLKRLMVYTNDPLVFYLKSIELDNIIIAIRSMEEAMKVLKNGTVAFHTHTMQVNKSTVKTTRVQITLKTIFEGDRKISLKEAKR